MVVVALKTLTGDGESSFLSYGSGYGSVAIKISVDNDFFQPSCRNLSSRNISYGHPVQDYYVNMHRRSIHVMQFPPPRSNFFLIVPPKSGNHNWKGLIYRLWTDKVPLSWNEIKDTNNDFDFNPRYRLLDEKYHMWLLVRNPYVRILSTYLEKVHCSSHLIGGFISESVEVMHVFRNYGNLTFEEFVVSLTNHMIFDDNRGKSGNPKQFLDLWVRSGGALWTSDPSSSDINVQYVSADEFSEGIKKNLGLLSPHNSTGIRRALRGSDQPSLRKTKQASKGKVFMSPFSDRGVSYWKNINYPDRIVPNSCLKRSPNVTAALIDPTGRVRAKRFPDASVVSPVERAGRLCTFDHHTCVQAAGLHKQQLGRVQVLRLEEQGMWFRQFSDCMGVKEEYVVGEEWTAFAGKPCFYTPTNSCADAMVKQTKQGLTNGAVHSRDTIDKMSQYYTPLAADLVYYLYEYDFVTLGYKRWNGIDAFA